MSWHVDVDAARRYTSRALDAIGSASVEAHLERCGDCRTVVQSSLSDIDHSFLGDVWARVDAAIDEPRRGWIESMLGRIGVDDRTARIVAATRRARWAYLFAVALSVGLAWLAWAADDERVLLAMFLIVAPVGPLLATAGSFSWADPAADILRTVPYSALRILLVRTAACVVPAIGLTALAVPWLLDDGWIAVAWLLPSLALVLGALALSSWIALEHAVVVLAVGWLVAVFTVQNRVSVATFAEVATPALQIASIVVAAASTFVIVVRRTAYEYREV
jgi:hypothetical protein